MRKPKLEENTSYKPKLEDQSEGGEGRVSQRFSYSITRVKN